LPSLFGNPFIDDKYSPYLVLAMFSSALAKPQPDWAANTVITGFTFYDGSEGGAELTPELKQFWMPVSHRLFSPLVQPQSRLLVASTKKAFKLQSS
jgi:hypothetical protein